MEQKFIITKEGLQKAKKELADLLAQRTDIIEKIDTARQRGDLKENAEYQSAKDQQGMNESKIAELEHLIKFAVVVEQGIGKPNIVCVGSTVVVNMGRGEKEFRIVGFNEANPTQGLISNESPIARALLGRKVGDTVAVELPNGNIVDTQIVKLE